MLASANGPVATFANCNMLSIVVLLFSLHSMALTPCRSSKFISFPPGFFFFWELWLYWKRLGLSGLFINMFQKHGSRFLLLFMLIHWLKLEDLVRAFNGIKTVWKKNVNGTCELRMSLKHFRKFDCKKNQIY